jgi:hypothetical protein
MPSVDAARIAVQLWFVTQHQPAHCYCVSGVGLSGCSIRSRDNTGASFFFCTDYILDVHVATRAEVCQDILPGLVLMPNGY